MSHPIASPLVTIAMPVYNCERSVGLAICSILEQTFQDWELIVIDDGSTDETVAKALCFQDERVKVYNDGEHLGLPRRLNQALCLAKGEYLARMDGDDVSYPDRLQIQLEYLGSNPDVDLVGAGVMVFGSGGEILGTRKSPESHEQICYHPYFGLPMAHPTYFAKAAWFRQYFYSEAALRAQDQDLLLRSWQTSRFANVPEILLGYYEEYTERKMLQSRLFVGRMVLAEAIRNGHLLSGLSAVVTQVLKGVVDTTALATGLRYNLLCHRAKPPSCEEVHKWERIWGEVNRKASIYDTRQHSLSRAQLRADGSFGR